MPRAVRKTRAELLAEQGQTFYCPRCREKTLVETLGDGWMKDECKGITCAYLMVWRRAASTRRSLPSGGTSSSKDSRPPWHPYDERAK